MGVKRQKMCPNSSQRVYCCHSREAIIEITVYKMIDIRTGTVLGTGKVTAIDGAAAAQRLALDIVGRIRSVRPLPAAEGR